jgi:hypothetical protein
MGLSGVNILNAMGAGGSLYANDTAAHTGDFTSIQFTEDSVLSAYVGKVENVSAALVCWLETPMQIMQSALPYHLAHPPMHS